MGLFGKLGGNKFNKKKSSNKKVTKKEKKSLFVNKKKDVTLLERMQLEESVATASVDVVQELAEIGGSAVREVDEGLMIVVITNEALEAAGLDPSGEEFGSFAQALRSETIESIALADDLASGVIGIIPSQESLISLDEFDFIHDIEFQWAIVPFDLSDDDRLTVLDSIVHIDRLVEMSNHPDIQIDIKNGEVVEVDDAYDQESDSDGTNDEFVNEDSNELDVEGVEDVEVDDSDMLDAEETLDADDYDDFPEDVDVEEDTRGDLYDPMYDSVSVDDVDYDELDVDEDIEAVDDYSEDLEDDDTLPDNMMDIDEEDEMTAEESKEAINRIASHGFHNTELGLNIDVSKFDDYFDSVTIARFDTARTDNSELQNILSKLRGDANVELHRFHQENVQSLRNKFTTSMRDIHNKLVESLDHKDENTTYGRRHYEIESDFEEAMDDLERRVANEIDQVNKAYNESRDEYAENARREALVVYDSRYRDERNHKIESIKEHVHTDLKTNRDTELGALYKDRRTVAQRLFDKATTALLQKLQEEYQEISQKELQMYDAFRKNMDVYLRKHFADEVLRAKAEAEKLKQSHEAERVRREYEQMLLTKTRQIEEADKQSRDALRQLQITNKEEVEQIRADYDQRIEREQRENQNLRDANAEILKSNSKIGEQKDEEVQHRMNMYEDALKAKDRELEYANQRANKSQKPMTFMLGAVAAVTLAVGIIFGFLYGANSIEIAPAANEVQPSEQTVSYHYDTPAETEAEWRFPIAG